MEETIYFMDYFMEVSVRLSIDVYHLLRFMPVLYRP